MTLRSRLAWTLRGIARRFDRAAERVEPVKISLRADFKMDQQEWERLGGGGAGRIEVLPCAQITQPLMVHRFDDPPSLHSLWKPVPPPERLVPECSPPPKIARPHDPPLLFGSLADEARSAREGNR